MGFYLFSSIGRAGRVSAGTCFRLVTREFYENALPEFGVPEMQVGSRTDSLPNPDQCKLFTKVTHRP